MNITLREEIFAEFNFADEQFSDKNFAHFDSVAHFDHHFSPILTVFSQREKKKLNFAKFNYTDRAKICKIFFCKNFFLQKFLP